MKTSRILIPILASGAICAYAFFPAVAGNPDSEKGKSFDEYLTPKNYFLTFAENEKQMVYSYHNGELFYFKGTNLNLAENIDILWHIENGKEKKYKLNLPEEMLKMERYPNYFDISDNYLVMLYDVNALIFERKGNDFSFLKEISYIKDGKKEKYSLGTQDFNHFRKVIIDGDKAMFFEPPMFHTRKAENKGIIYAELDLKTGNGLKTSSIPVADYPNMFVWAMSDIITYDRESKRTFIADPLSYSIRIFDGDRQVGEFENSLPQWAKQSAGNDSKTPKNKGFRSIFEIQYLNSGKLMVAWIDSKSKGLKYDVWEEVDSEFKLLKENISVTQLTELSDIDDYSRINYFKNDLQADGTLLVPDWNGLDRNQYKDISKEEFQEKVQEYRYEHGLQMNYNLYTIDIENMIK
jgi:hypothetical protein